MAPTQGVADATRSERSTRVEAQPGPDWLGIVEGSSRHASSAEIFQGFLARLAGRCRFVTAWVAPDQPAAICLGVTSPGFRDAYSYHYRIQGAV